MDELFSKIGDFKVVRLGKADAEDLTDHLKTLRELVLENEPMYPNIDTWFDKKVIPGMKISERVGYVGYLDGKPVVSSIVKRGKAAKFCHLNIKPNLQDTHLGEAFFTLMAIETRNLASEIHFTLPESLWVKKSSFFSSFGFTRAEKAGHQYRLFEDELRCSSPFQRVWNAILNKLPKISRLFSINGYSLDKRILMSIKAEYAQKVLMGEKKVEIRRKFSQKWQGHKVSIYASRPNSAIVGEVSIHKVVVDNPDNIWCKFQDQIACTKEEFYNYAGELTKVYAILLEDAIPYKSAVSLKSVTELSGRELRAPQNYYQLTNNGWAEAVSIGALLQDCPTR
jgi:predicted transcriptional regulator